MAGRHSRRRWALARARIPEQRDAKGRHRSMGITDALTCVEHRVSDESAAAHRHTGNYPALCGQHVLAASLVARPARSCEVCEGSS